MLRASVLPRLTGQCAESPSSVMTSGGKLEGTAGGRSRAAPGRGAGGGHGGRGTGGMPAAGHGRGGRRAGRGGRGGRRGRERARERAECPVRTTSSPSSSCLWFQQQRAGRVSIQSSRHTCDSICFLCVPGDVLAAPASACVAGKV